MKVVLATLNAKYIHSSLALRYLRQFCREVCPDIAVKEYTINNEISHILGDIYREQPDVLGLACYIWNIEATLSLAEQVKKVLPHTAIVLGGPEVSYDAEDIMSRNLFIDYIIQGEGEEVFAALLAALRDGLPVPPVVPGLSYRSGDTIVKSAPVIVENLDKLPAAYEIQDINALKDKIIYYESSRGCPYSCQYCLSSATRGVRFFDLKRVLGELEIFVQANVRQVKFVDRTFNAKREHYRPILEYLAKVECRTNFHFEIAADLLDDEVLAFLRNVPPGRFQFEIGVQSTNPCTLRAVRRINDWPKIVKTVKTIMGAGNIHIHLDLIAGLPYEGYASFARSFNKVYRLRPDMLQLGFLKLLKGSGIRMAAAEQEYLYSERAPYEVLANRYLSYHDIRLLKIIEDLLNQTYNSGRFKYTLELLVGEYREDAFRLFHEFAEFWDRRDLHQVAHGGKALYEYLYEFIMTVNPGIAVTTQEFLKFDALCAERGTVRPDSLPWNADRWAEQVSVFWRDEAKVRKYLPDFKFNTWREIRKRFHIEVFDVNVPECLQAGTKIAKGRTAVLFAYQEGESKYQLIEATDFWPEGSE